MFNFGQKNIEDLKSLSLEVDTFFFLGEKVDTFIV